MTRLVRGFCGKICGFCDGWPLIFGGFAIRIGGGGFVGGRGSGLIFMLRFLILGCVARFRGSIAIVILSVGDCECGGGIMGSYLATSDGVIIVR